MNNMTELSIVTATYNRINSLRKNIKSVAAQSLKDKEHIIIDSLSTDGTDKLINDYIKEADYPVIYIREKDSGPYDAINKGIKISNGEWVHTLHSDDCYYSNENLEKVLSAETKNIDVLTCAILVKDASSPCSQNSLWIPKYEDKINHYSLCQLQDLTKSVLFLG